jgi:(p)ppGpp synthase/HD superfamily hydrolase
MATNEKADTVSKSMVGPDSVLSRRIADAVEFAVRAHGGQVRKRTTIPYVSHLLGVAALVLEGGGDEDLAIAGLLHDVLEDTSATAAEIEEAFGPRVAAVVVGCSDTLEKSKPPTLERKQLYLEHLEHADADTLLVSLADKLHNARTLLLDFRTEGPSVFERFKLSREETLWYYGELADTFCRRRPGALADELKRVVADLRREVIPGQPWTDTIKTPNEDKPNPGERFVSKPSDTIDAQMYVNGVSE